MNSESAIADPSDWQSLLRYLYRREKLFLKATPESLSEAGKISGFLDQAFVRRKTHPVPPEDTPDALLLVLTRSCQINCPSCVCLLDGGGMSIDTVRKGVKLLMGSRRNEYRLHLTGGEPLLRFDLVEAAVLEAEELRIKKSKRPVYMLVTNGLAIEDRMIDFFRKFNIWVRVRFDGLEETYRLQRLGGHQDPLYQKIRLNLEKLANSGVNYDLVINIFPEEISSLEDNVLYLSQLGHKQIAIGYHFIREWPDERIRLLMDAMRHLARLSREEDQFELINLREPQWKSIFYGNTYMIADVDGGLYHGMGRFLEKGYGLARRDFYVAPLEFVESLDNYSVSPFDNFYTLANIYGRKNPSLRSLILNHIKVCYAVDGALRAASI
ncbi:MAG: radical SAM protein [Elusimicrobiota bacterium]